MKKRALVTMIALATVLFLLVAGGGCSLFHKEAPGDPAEKEADPEEAKDNRLMIY